MGWLANTLIAVGYFVLALSSDYFSVEWQEARERRRARRCGNIAVFLSVLSWIPVILFVTTYNWQVIVADLLGSWIGSYWAVKKRKVEKCDCCHCRHRSDNGSTASW